MFIRWSKYQRIPKRIDNVLNVDLVSTGDVNFRYLCKGKSTNKTLIKERDFDFVNIQDEGK